MAEAPPDPPSAEGAAHSPAHLASEGAGTSRLMVAGALGALAWGLWLVVQSGRPARDALAALVLLAAGSTVLWAARWLEANLPFAPGPGAEALRIRPSGRHGWLGLLAFGVASAIAIAACWSALTLHAEASPRFLIVATRHSDEGLYKQILLRMLEVRTLDPHPEYLYFNYGHLHLNLVMAPLLTVQSQLADAGAVALVAARLVNFGSLLALAGLGTLWLGRRRGPVAGVCFGAIVLTQDTFLTRALIAQSPDVLCALLCCVSAAKAAVFAEERRTRDLTVAVFLAGAGFGTKYIGLFLLPILVPLLAWAWLQAARLETGSRPPARRVLQVVSAFGAVFGGALFLCSPYHALEPKAMALVFFRAGSEYMPGSATFDSPYAAAFNTSLLDVLLGASLVLGVVGAGAQGLRRWRRGQDPVQSLQVLAAWALLWTSYAVFALRTNVGPHLLLPVLALYPLPLMIGISLLPRLHLKLGACAVLLACAWFSPSLERSGRPDTIRWVLEHDQRDSLLPRHLEFKQWLEVSGLGPETRISSDENPTYVPDRFPTYAHSWGAYFPRGVGQFLSLPEVLVVSKGWLELYPTIQSASNLRVSEKREFYAALARGSAPPYERVAETTDSSIYVVPWAWGRELLTGQVELQGALEARPFENPSKVHFIGAEFLAYRETPGGSRGDLSLRTTFELPAAAQARWLVLLWESRENFAGWYKDEAYAGALRLEAESPSGVWTPLLSLDQLEPDAYGGLWRELPEHLPTRRYRLQLSSWHGPRPAGIKRLSLLSAGPPGSAGAVHPPR